MWELQFFFVQLLHLPVVSSPYLTHKNPLATNTKKTTTTKLEFWILCFYLWKKNPVSWALSLHWKSSGTINKTLSFFFLHVSSQQNTNQVQNSHALIELSDGVHCYSAKTFEAEECHTAIEQGRKGFDCRSILSTWQNFGFGVFPGKEKHTTVGHVDFHGLGNHCQEHLTSPDAVFDPKIQFILPNVTFLRLSRIARSRDTHFNWTRLTPETPKRRRFTKIA